MPKMCNHLHHIECVSLLTPDVASKDDARMPSGSSITGKSLTGPGPASVLTSCLVSKTESVTFSVTYFRNAGLHSLVLTIILKVNLATIIALSRQTWRQESKTLICL